MRLVEFLTPKRTLYVCRPVVNSNDLIQWATAQGFRATLPAADLHVTVAYSKTPLTWDAAEASRKFVVAKGGRRRVQALGDKGAVVLRFACAALGERWQAFCDQGASWDFPSYKPHVTLTYDAEGVDLNAVEPYRGALILGAERFAPINEDWAVGRRETLSGVRAPRGQPPRSAPAPRNRL